MTLTLLFGLNSPLISHENAFIGKVTKSPMSDKPTATIELPLSIIDRVEDRVHKTEFRDVEEYVTYVLEEVLSQVEQKNDNDTEKIDEDEVRSRLESLGYLEDTK